MIKRTIYILPKGTEPTGEVVADLIKTHESDRSVFNILESYVDDEPMMDRTAPNELLAIHNFAQYILSINTGYLLGTPVEYQAKDNKDIDKLNDHYNHQSIAEIDTDLDTDRSMFGQAFENVYIDEDSHVTSAKLSVYNTIMVYDDTFKHKEMFAIYYAKQDETSGAANTKYDVTIWTDTHVLNRKLNNRALEEDPDNPDYEHYFKAVPVIHYYNNRRMKGDYEPVLSLINAYNILQSDRIIDREKLVDAILAFYGAKLTKEDQAAIKENRTIGLPEGAKAEYLIKQIDEADADVLRKTLAADIHKFSMTPDLSDETFGNAPSGVSILYKLLSFEQNIKRKERMFDAGLRKRLKLYTTVMATQSKIGKPIDPNEVDIVFRRSLPKNNYETSEMINNLDGIVDRETLVGQLDFVKDASSSIEKAQDQNLGTGKFGTDEAEE